MAGAKIKPSVGNTVAESPKIETIHIVFTKLKNPLILYVIDLWLMIASI